MSLPSAMSPVLHAMLRGTTVLTPNVRAARALARTYDAHQRAQGNIVWEPAKVLSWGGWISSVWADATVAGTVTSVLLNDLQEKALWHRILDGANDLGLGSSAPLAALCSSALRLLGAYDVHNHFAGTGPNDTPDTAAFRRWYERFTATCRQERLLPASYRDAELATLLRSGAVTAPGEYLLYGFDALTPAQRAVVEALRNTGSLIDEHWPYADQTAPPVLLRCADADAEVDACCRWAKERLQADPFASIMILTADANADVPALQRKLRASVAPWTQDITRQQGAALLETSIGRSLATLPIVEDAVRLLRWCAAPVTFADAGAVLRSPFLSIAASPEQGAELEAWVLLDTHRARNGASLRGELSLREAERILRPASQDVANRLGALSAAVIRGLTGRHTNASFADRVRTLLVTAGWPGAGIDSEEFQAMGRWDDLLDRVASLDIFGERVTFGDWLQAVESAAADTTFAPENTAAPIQIVTVAEAAGSTADAAWFLQMDEHTWPPRRDPHPLLPRSLQRQLRMPGADVEADEAAALHALQRRLSAVPESHFSYAEQGDAGSVQPSPMVLAISHLVHGTGERDVPVATITRLEDLQDTAPLPALSAQSTGGVSILASQGQCGFRAFAERRLQAQAMEAMDAGLNAAERGEQVHAVLEKFWSKCLTHSQLKEWSAVSTAGATTRRDEELQACIDSVVARPAEGTWDFAYLTVQRERLFRLLSGWLDAELARTPFRVDALELEVPSARLGPLNLKVRVDRIDRVQTADGEAAILIDYKTGNAERKDWFGERPDAPQLPTYALAAGIPNVQGIAFGRVRVGKLGMNFEEMLADRNLLGIGKSRRTGEPSFDDRMAEWQRDLTALAEAFARGDAAVDPKDYLTTCKNCSSRLLCRVDVSRLEPDDDLLEEVEEEGLA